MKIDERRVRELAYQIWESEGRPDGQHERHWRMALSLAAAEAGEAVPENEEPVQPRFEGEQEPEKPAILQEPPRRKGRLPKATPETPDAPQTSSEAVAPPPPAERNSPPKARPARGAPTDKQRKSKPSAAAKATSKPSGVRPPTSKPSPSD
ncbi:DUF2934 domain-containing protein [Pseudomonas nitroreducens]|uniref:DUF2934 domain-containing protein n=1 Tax=Pseudomonas nitroreducens TaxID=46680 RepID=UPI0023F6BA11|nr:DUF2934 domain-containing protein [Pseudomonas nitroreducens]WEW96494.1 DUF2934 domain-containing protein [Pseudomonas nitroreducens]